MTDIYIEKNRGFMTSSKLKEFVRCQKCYKWKYEDEIPDPTADFETADHFVIGQALDDRLTHGEEAYKEKYFVVARRMDCEEERKIAEEKISEGSRMCNKDGSHSAAGKKMVMEGNAKLQLIEKLKGKIQITAATADQVEACYVEFRANPVFRQSPVKKAIEFDFDGIKLRGELDDFDREKRLIVDVKTAANLQNFNPDFYVFQMSFYQWLVEETEGEKCEAMLEIVDKYKFFSRSRALLYSQQTLETHRGIILQALSDYKMAKESGVWLSATSENVLLTCPYYGYAEGHGRPTEPIYY